MSLEVIMPALGMAQDSGLILAWLKKPGDRVQKGEPLFEVETDKASVEVEAQADGFLSAVRAGVGDEVPVGHPIAEIVASEGEVRTDAAPSGQPPAEAPAPAPAGVSQPVHEAARAPAPDPKPRSAPTPLRAPVPGRVLASPKARRLAAEQGLDLTRLAAAGHPQPYHSADLALFASLGSGRRWVLSARADGTAIGALLSKAAPGTDRGRLFAGFAAGAWRAVFDAEASVTLQRPDGTVESIGPAGGAALRVVDLTSTRVISCIPAEPGVAVSVARDVAGFTFTLSADDTLLTFADAVAWLDELAARLEDPIRQLL